MRTGTHESAHSSKTQITSYVSKSIGAHAVLDLIVDELPSPAARPEVAGTDLKTKQAGTRAADPKAPVIRDPD